MGKFTIPQITWGSSYVNTLNLGFQLDNFSSYSKPRDGSEWCQSTSGVEDAWVVRRDYYLAGDVRWIPTNGTTSPLATGWDGSTGVRAFLEWAQDKNQFRFYPDKNTSDYISSYLVEPVSDISVQAEPDATRQFRIVMRNASSAYDGY